LLCMIWMSASELSSVFAVQVAFGNDNQWVGRVRDRLRE
jgi:hypothetical protein